MTLHILYTKQFIKSSKKLPKSQQEKLAVLLSIIQAQPFSPQLHTKPLTGKLVGFYSFRISREWRVIFQFLDPNTIKLLETAHRKDIYR